jgi:PAS domain S-box-containing protein
MEVNSGPRSNEPMPAGDLLAAILDTSQDALFTVDREGLITFWSRGAEGVFGFRSEEVIGRSTAILRPSEHKEAHLLESIEQGERIESFTTVGRHKDGSLRQISLRISPLKVDGKVIGALHIARDITEQVRTSDLLLRSEQRHRVTLSSIGDAVIATDVRGRVDFMNPVAEELTGWTEQEAQALPLDQVLKLVHERTREPVENPVAKILRDGVVAGLATPTVLIARNGKEWPVSDSAAPIRDPCGDLAGVVLVFREITHERAAQLASERLAAIVESSDDGIVGKDLRGIVTSWNSGAERIFGYTSEEMIGQSITRILPAHRLDEEQDILARLQRGERVDHFETVRVTKEGRLLDVALTISPIRNETGEIIGASKIARDISIRKAAEKALADAQSRLESHAEELEARVRQRTSELQGMVAELESFSYTISHDLRAPLRGMHQFSQLLLMEYADRLDETAQGYLERIIRSAQRMDRLIQDVLAYGAVSRSHIKPGRVDLNELVAETIDQYPSLQRPAAEVQIKGPLLAVMAHEALLSQCLSNLLGNAVKFVPAGRKPEVRVWTEAHGQCVRINVADNGIGIAPQHHGRIFQIFERLEGAYEGTGIGLAIVRKAVERMGGTIGLESEPCKGSKFWIELPAAG